MPLPDVSVNRSSPVPLYFQLAEQIEGAIHDGRLAPGDRIANEVALADRLGLSRPTVRQAIHGLVDKGLLVRKRGVGTQVVRPPIRRTVELTSLYDDLTRNRLSPTTTVLGLESVTPDDTLRQRLDIEADERVWRLDRLRCAEGEPLALMSNVVPASVVDLSVADLERTGLYEHFRTLGIHLRVAHQVIGARTVDAREARLLDRRKGDPVLTMERTSYDDQGRPVEYGLHLYRPDRYAYQTTLVDR